MIIKKIKSFVKSFKPHVAYFKSTGFYTVRKRNKYTLYFEYLDLCAYSKDFWWSKDSSCFKFCLTDSIDIANKHLNEHLEYITGDDKNDMGEEV